MSDPTLSPAQLADLASRAALLYRAAHAADNAPGAGPEAGLEDALRAERLAYAVLSALEPTKRGDRLHPAVCALADGIDGLNATPPLSTLDSIADACIHLARCLTDPTLSSLDLEG
jgi:hypothetical protein